MHTVWNKVIAGFRTNILIGLFLLAPLVVTLLIFNLIITFISNHIVPSTWLATSYAPLFRIMAIIVVVAAIYFVGLLTRNFVGKKIFRFADWTLTRIPVINSVYTSIRQISESLVSSQSTLFKDVVAIQFPRIGIYAIAFVTARAPEMITTKIETETNSNSDMICIFLPTSPNPTSGFFLMVEKSEITYLNISVAAAMKMIISSGAASPWKSATDPKQTLLDHIETWLKRGENSPSADQPKWKNKQSDSK